MYEANSSKEEMEICVLQHLFKVVTLALLEVISIKRRDEELLMF